MGSVSTACSLLTARPPPTRQLCFVGVDKAAANHSADLRSKNDAEALVVFKRSDTGAEPAPPKTCVLQSHGAAIVFLASRLFGHRSRNREHHDERRPPKRRVPIEAELPDRARARVAVSHVGRPVELLPEARADRVDGRNLGHGQHNVAAIRDDADHPAYARLQRTQHTAIIGGADFELVRGLHAGDVVPLECDGPCVVGLQFEAGKLHARDFAGHVVAVAEPDDIGLGLGPRRGAWPPDERRENECCGEGEACRALPSIATRSKL